MIIEIKYEIHKSDLLRSIDGLMHYCGFSVLHSNQVITTKYQNCTNVNSNRMCNIYGSINNINNT